MRPTPKNPLHHFSPLSGQLRYKTVAYYTIGWNTPKCSLHDFILMKIPTYCLISQQHIAIWFHSYSILHVSKGTPRHGYLGKRGSTWSLNKNVAKTENAKLNQKQLKLLKSNYHVLQSMELLKRGAIFSVVLFHSIVLQIEHHWIAYVALHCCIVFFTLWYTVVHYILMSLYCFLFSSFETFLILMCIGFLCTVWLCSVV